MRTTIIEPAVSRPSRIHGCVGTPRHLSRRANEVSGTKRVSRQESDRSWFHGLLAMMGVVLATAASIAGVYVGYFAASGERLKMQQVANQSAASERTESVMLPYQIEKGDTLRSVYDKIDHARYLLRYDKFLRDNADVAPDPDHVPAGTWIRIKVTTPRLESYEEQLRPLRLALNGARVEAYLEKHGYKTP